MKNDCVCNHIRLCFLNNIIDCPCRICLVNTMCSKVCYDRHIFVAKDLKLEPYTESQFNRGLSNWTLMEYNHNEE